MSYYCTNTSADCTLIKDLQEALEALDGRVSDCEGHIIDLLSRMNNAEEAIANLLNVSNYTKCGLFFATKNIDNYTNICGMDGTPILTCSGTACGAFKPVPYTEVPVEIEE